MEVGGAGRKEGVCVCVGVGGGAQCCACRDPESFARGGPTLNHFFLVDDGRENLNITKRGPLLAVRETPLKWCFVAGR